MVISWLVVVVSERDSAVCVLSGVMVCNAPGRGTGTYTYTYTYAESSRPGYAEYG